MAYDLARLSSYVRFYLTVVTQLRAAWVNLARTHGIVKEAVSPFAASLAPVRSTALAAALDAPAAFEEGFGDLWRPTDEEGLGGLNDVYEVVGRFCFQGEDNKNLGRVQALVSGARNEIVAQRGRVADLAKLADVARAVAARLGSEEAARAYTERAEKASAFEPLAEQVAARAKQTYDAVRAVPFPDLSNAETAAEEYKRYAAKLDQVYQTCLPFLRKAIAALYAFVSCEPGASWPDTLPVERELPAELVTVPPADSPELSQARSSLHGLGDEEIQLGRARDEIATTIARLEGEMAAGAVRDKEIEIEIATATAIIDYVTTTELAETAKKDLASLEQQKSVRVQAAGQVWQRHKAIEAGIKVLEEELAKRSQQMTAVEEQLQKERGDEPVLFGKDEWRGRVAALEAQQEGLTSAYGQRLNALNQLKIDFSTVSVEVQTEQSQGGIVDRQIAETRAKLDAMQKALREWGARLGAARPARPVTPKDAQEGLAVLQDARMELAQRAERLKTEIRRQREETVRVLTRMKQIGVERQQFQAMLQSAQVAVTQGREEALRQLAAQRRAAVERHVGEVISTLEKSQAAVGPVFIEPAREAMLKMIEPRSSEAAGVLDGAEKVAPVMEKLAGEIDSELLAQDATLGQIQREFCDVAVDACRSAWG